MQVKENWKEYLIPGCLASGLLAMMVSVAVLGRTDYERDGSRPFVTEDVSIGFFSSADESIDFDDDPFAPVDSLKEKAQETNKGGDAAESSDEASNPDFSFDFVEMKEFSLIKKPENMENALEFDKWKDRHWDSIRLRIRNIKSGDAPQLLKEVSEIRESDGAIYYFLLGYIHDTLLRDSPAVELRDQHHAKAVENYDKAIELNDKIAHFHHFRGQADYFYAIRTNSPEYYSKALPFYAKAEQCAPDWVFPVAMQGWCHFRLGNDKEAVALFERAIKIDADNRDAIDGLQQARPKLAEDDVWDFSFGSFDTSPIEKPENIENTLEFGKWNDKFWNFLTRRIDKIHSDDVPQLLEEISEIRESDGAVYYYALGYIYHLKLWYTPEINLSKEYYAKAVENFDKAIELNDKVATFYYFRGLADFRFAERTKQPQDYANAQQYFVKAGQLAPDWIIPVALQGRCTFDLGKFRESVALLERVAENDPSSWDAVHLLPRARAKLEQAADFLDHDMPLDFTGQIVSRRIKKPVTTESRELDRWNDAFREIVVKAGQVRPEDVPERVMQWTGLTEDDGKFYHYVCGYVHDRMSRLWKDFRLSHYTQAVAHYTKAIEQDDSVAVFYHFRGQVNYFFAENENAPEYYEKAIEDYIAAERCDLAWPMPPNMQGWALFRLQKYGEAVTCFERAIAIDADCFDAMSGMVHVIDKKTELDPTNIEMLKQGLDWIERWHKVIITRNNDHELPNGTELARKLIARWKDQETISPMEYPKCFTRRELEDQILFPLSDEDGLIVYDWLMSGEVSPYIYHDYKHSTGSDFSSQTQEIRVLFKIATIHLRQGNYDKALAMIEAYQKIPDNDVTVGYSDVPNIHHIHIKSLYCLGRYEDVIDYYTSGGVTLEQLIEWGRSHEPLYAYVALAMHKAGQTEQMLGFVANFEQPNRNIVELIVGDSRQKPDPIPELFIRTYLDALYQKAVDEDVDHTRNVPQSTIVRLCYLLNRVIDYDSSYHPFYKKLGDMFFECKQYASAAEHYEQYLKYASHDTDVLEPLLQCYETLQNAKEAVRVATILIMIHPDNPDHWIRRARLQHKYYDYSHPRSGSLSINDMERAIELLERDGETDKKRLAQAYLWRGDMLCFHDRSHHAAADYMKAVELTAETPLDEVRFENAKGVKTVYAYRELLYRLLNSRNDPRAMETPVSELCTEFILQGGDELFLIASRAEARQWESELLKAIDDFLVVMEFSKAEKHTDVAAIGYPEIIWISREHACYQLANCYQSLSVSKPKNKDYFDKAIEYCTRLAEKYPGYRGLELPYSWRSYLYRIQVEKNDQLTDEERERYQLLSEENVKMIEQIREREAANID